MPLACFESLESLKAFQVRCSQRTKELRMPPPLLLHLKNKTRAATKEKSHISETFVFFKSIVSVETGETRVLIEIEIFVRFLKRKMFLCTSLN